MRYGVVLAGGDIWTIPDMHVWLDSILAHHHSELQLPTLNTHRAATQHLAATTKRHARL
jgi:hypothetical protein